MWPKTFVLVLACAVTSVLSSKILVVMPTGAKSHYFMYRPLIIELARRGHEVTVVSPIVEKEKFEGLTFIDASEKVKTFFGSLPIEEVLSLTDPNHFKRTYESLKDIYYFLPNMTDIFNVRTVQELIRSNRTFDLVVTELFLTDAIVAFAHRFNAPHMTLTTCAILPWGNRRFGNPENPSYVPQVFGRFRPKMNFRQRLYNTFDLLVYNLGFAYLMDPFSQGIAEKHFKGVPPLRELVKHTSLMLVNTHHSLHGSRPYVPNVIEVGGLHVQPLGNLSQELQTYLDESKHGVIYFCMGSMLKASTIPDDKRDALVEVFSKLKQNVLWKWEDDTLPGKPDNVKLVKWMPQRDVLAHPNVKLFISHGGLLGTTEAVYCGVPIIGIPFYGDQGVNIEAVASNGAGLRLDFHDINSETLYKAITEILNNPKYSENAKSLSERFRDRPLSPLETAVYWTEYVIRHKGAPHLRSAAVDLTWYQYLLLDVIAFILAILTSILLVFYYSIKFVIKRFRSSKKDAKEHQEQKFKKQTSQKPKVKKS